MSLTAVFRTSPALFLASAAFACGGSAQRCDAAWLSLGESGCALPPADHGFSELNPDEVCPTTISVEVSRDGRSLITTTVTPAYTEDAPNGPGCGPICQGAATRIALTSF